MKRWLSTLGSLVGRLKRRSTRAAVSELRLRYVPAYEEVHAAMEFEVRRARRYERPLVVLVLTTNRTVAGSAMGNGKHSDNEPPAPLERGVGHDTGFEAHVSSMLLGEILHVAIREVDIAGYDPESDRYVICLPESDTAGAQHAVERIEKLLRDRAVSHVRVGAAVFPNDALTLNDLVSHADQRFRKSHLTVYSKEASA